MLNPVQTTSWNCSSTLYQRAKLLLAGLIMTGAVSCSKEQGPATTVKPKTEPGVWQNSIGMKFRQIPGTQKVMSIYETRVQDFRAFVDDTGYDATKGTYYYNKKNKWVQDGQSWENAGPMQTRDNPVAGINWRDAVAFCLWLTDVEHRNRKILSSQAYRLPTEEEWARAAGKQTSPPYPKQFGNYHEVRDFDVIGFTSPAGMFPPNEHGFYDMAGNVWEFCVDEDKREDNFHIICGGSWQNWHSQFVGMGARGRTGPDIRITLYGFRIVLAPVDGLITKMRNDAMRISDSASAVPPYEEPPPAEGPIPE